jgi:putative sigma-54 modulation protein
MNLQLTGQHVEITPAIRNYVLSKLERINRHFDQKIEANVHLSGKDIHVEANDADMYAAIDCLSDKLDRQILKHKERFQVHKHDAGIKRIPQGDV